MYLYLGDLMKVIFVMFGVLIFSINSVSAQNVSSAKALKSKFDDKIKETIDQWYRQDINAYSTGHVCQPTTVATTVVSPILGLPVVTFKINTLGELLEGLAKVYPYMNPDYKLKIETISKNTYFWLYKQIDWRRKLIADNYGACYHNNPSSYSHLTTPHTVKGLLAFRKNLSPNDANYAKLSQTIETLAVGHLQNIDGWMTDASRSANFMALNLSVLSALNEINPQHVYIRDSLARRLRTDYGWIRSSWVNYESEQYCNVPLLFGGWSHSSPEIVAPMKNVRMDCSYLDQKNTDSLSKEFRSYYLQKVSYHTIITKGLMDIHNTIKKRNDCNLVRYGSQGTCVEMKNTILLGAASWLYEMIKDDGRIPTAYQSYSQDEFQYFSDRYGTAHGITNLIQILHSESASRNYKNFNITYGYSDSNQPRTTKSIKSMESRILKSLEFAINRTSVASLFLLQDAAYLASEIY